MRAFKICKFVCFNSFIFNFYVNFRYVSQANFLNVCLYFFSINILRMCFSGFSTLSQFVYIRRREKFDCLTAFSTDANVPCLRLIIVCWLLKIFFCAGTCDGLAHWVVYKNMGITWEFMQYTVKLTSFGYKC